MSACASDSSTGKRARPPVGATSSDVAAMPRCSMFLTQKKRYCSGVRVQGTEFCGHHVVDGRVPCPIDPSHSVPDGAAALARHVLVCSSGRADLRTQSLPCYSSSCNAGGSLTDSALLKDELAVVMRFRNRVLGTEALPPANNVEHVVCFDTEHADTAHNAHPTTAAWRSLADDGANFVARVMKWHDLIVSASSGAATEQDPGPVPLVAPWDSLLARSHSSIVSAREKRHVEQHVRMGAAMQDAGLFASLGASSSAAQARNVRAPLFIEMGAGRGELSATIAEAVADASFLLVDRDTARHKADGPMRRGEAREARSGRLRQAVRVSHGGVAHQRCEEPGTVAASSAHEGGATAPDLAPTSDAGAGHGLQPRCRVERVRIDIRDFNMSRHPLLCGRGVVDSDSTEAPSPDGHITHTASAVTVADDGSRRNANVPDMLPVIAMWKHLCGSATDLAIVCLVRSLGRQSRTTAADVADGINGSATCQPAGAAEVVGSTSGDVHAPTRGALSSYAVAPYLHGVAVAPCCHHRCEWEHYVGRSYFRDVLHATAEDFERMRALSGWATMGPAAPHHMPSTDAAAAHDSDALRPESTGNDMSALSRDDRIGLGRMCKRIIDAGRMHYLRGAFSAYGPEDSTRGVPIAEAAHAVGAPLSMRVAMRTYCDEALSPENAIVLGCAAWRGERHT